MTYRTVNNLPAATHGEPVRCLFARAAPRKGQGRHFLRNRFSNRGRRLFGTGPLNLSCGDLRAGGRRTAADMLIATLWLTGGSKPQPPRKDFAIPPQMSMVAGAPREHISPARSP
jgi:hypothetical protein